MRCLYREKKHYCGDYLEADVFPVFEYQRGRSKKRKPTSETMKKLNQRNAERKLIRLLNTNFTKEDIRFDLTYDSEHCPASPEDAQREMQNFLRRVKRYRKKNGLPELKYVAVTEVGSKSGRIHHHIVMSGGVSINELADIWGRGYTTAKPLQFDEQGLAGIAKYLVKDEPGKPKSRKADSIGEGRTLAAIQSQRMAQQRLRQQSRNRKALRGL